MAYSLNRCLYEVVYLLFIYTYHFHSSTKKAPTDSPVFENDAALNIIFAETD
jgi:hypothetical protein